MESRFTTDKIFTVVRMPCGAVQKFSDIKGMRRGLLWRIRILTLAMQQNALRTTRYVHFPETQNRIMSIISIFSALKQINSKIQRKSSSNENIRRFGQWVQQMKDRMLELLFEIEYGLKRWQSLKMTHPYGYFTIQLDEVIERDGLIQEIISETHQFLRSVEAH